MKLAVLVLALAGCDLYFDPADSSDEAWDYDAGPPPFGDCRNQYTATIFEPIDAQLYPRAIKTRVRWNESGIPDRYTSMSDHFDNYFQPTGSQIIHGDGSIENTYTLPAGGSFIFEIGWICDVQTTESGISKPLAVVEFKTDP